MIPPATSSHWHTITPQTRPLTLTVLQLTPLALTLSLTLATNFTTRSPSHLSLQHVAHIHNHAHGPAKNRKKTRHRHSESDDELTAVEADDEYASLIPGTYPNHGLLEGGSNFKDLLSHGVVVSVNGQPWNRIVAHVSDTDDEEADVEVGVEEDGEWEDDPDHATEEGATKRRPRKAKLSLGAGEAVKDAGDREDATGHGKRGNEKDKERWQKDRAVVVVYGLSPGKEYEIELRVVGLSGQGGESLGELCASRSSSCSLTSTVFANSL